MHWYTSIVLLLTDLVLLLYMNRTYKLNEEVKALTETIENLKKTTDKIKECDLCNGKGHQAIDTKVGEFGVTWVYDNEQCDKCHGVGYLNK